MALTPGPKEVEFNNWYDTKFKPAMERGPLDKYVARQAWFAATEPLLECIAALEAQVEQAAQPIDMVLHCPACGMQHVDAPSPTDGQNLRMWSNPPHKSHLCRPEDGGCGHIWRPADVPTNGVAAIKTKGKADSRQPAVTRPQPVGWQKAILRSEEDGMVIIGWDYCTEAEFGHLRIPKRKLYTSPPKAAPLTTEQIDRGLFMLAPQGSRYWKAEELAFREGVRFAEQVHNITPATVEKGETP